MPSSFSHAIGGLALGSPAFREAVPRRFWVLAALSATSVDLDYLWASRSLPSEHWLAHRGLTHSLLFAAVLAGVVTALAFRARLPSLSRWRVWLGLTLATASHGVLDALSTYGAGVGFFIPFSTARFFLPVRPLSAGPGPHDHGLLGGLLETIGRELLWIWLPSLLLLALMARARRRRLRAGSGRPQ